MAEATAQEVMEAVDLFRKDYEGNLKHQLTEDEKGRVLKALDAQEETSQALTLANEKVKTLEVQIGEQVEKVEELTTKAVTADQLKAEVETLEALVAQRKGNDPDQKDAWKDSDEYKSLVEWAGVGIAQLPEETKATLRTDNDSAGGFLAPTEFANDLLKEVIELDPIRALARVRTIASKAVELAVRTDIPRATYEGEAEENQEDIGNYRMVTATPYRQSISIPITLDLIMNGAFDMEAELIADAGIGFAEGEGIGFVSGSGHKVPEGVTQNPTVIANLTAGTDLSSIDTSDDAVLADAIIAVTGELKVGYNASYQMHRRTLARIRQIRDGANGQFLWQPGLNGPVSNTINGFPYALTPSLSPWDSAGGDFMIFGDWGRGYTIVDRTGLSIVRDEVTRARKAIIVFTMHRWNTGLVTVPEAFRMIRRNP